MASTNQSPQYQKAEVNFLNAQTDKERIRWLDEMIKECPKHKSAEKMLANLKTRRKKLLEKIERSKKVSSGSSKKGIKKEEMQAAIIGFTNSGKSSLISTLTNANPEVSKFPFTTKQPIIGMMPFSGTHIQMIEVPAIDSEFYDKGIVNTADIVLILVNDLNQIKSILQKLDKAEGKRLIIFNIKTKEDKRKIEATLKSKKYNFHILDFEEKENLEELKEKMFQSFNKIRIFTKESHKERSKRPLILETRSTVKEVAEKIIKNLDDVKETKIWGPSSKFPGQVVGLQHILKDLDIVEFKTR